MAKDRSIFFNVLALENILVALTREIGDGACFLYKEFSWKGVNREVTSRSGCYRGHPPSNCWNYKSVATITEGSIIWE